MTSIIDADHLLEFCRLIGVTNDCRKQLTAYFQARHQVYEIQSKRAKIEEQARKMQEACRHEVLMANGVKICCFCDKVIE